MRFTTAAFALTAFAASARAHMIMTEPAPFRSKSNPNVPPDKVDFEMVKPLNPDGSDFPCKGYLGDFDVVPDGNPTAEWAPGSSQKVSIAGGAPHGGGSCQLSLSFDKGKTFRVVKSIEGDCPTGEEDLDFTLPQDTKSGKAIFAWTWFNQIGNREMYMNCAAVKITGSGTSELDDRPKIFTANIGNGCTVPEGTDVKFPDPGPDVQDNKSKNLGAPPGNCGSSSPEPKPEESTDPSTDPSKSADPGSNEPTYTAEPSHSDEPTKSEGPEEPTKSEEPEPSHSDEPAKSEEPTKSAEPTDPANPAETKSKSEPEYAQPTEKPESTPVPTATSNPSASASASEAPASTSTAPGSSVGTTYTVKSGDICEKIAGQQGISLSTLYQLNPKVNKECTNLMPGQVLNLRRRSRIMRDLN